MVYLFECKNIGRTMNLLKIFFCFSKKKNLTPKINRENKKIKKLSKPVRERRSRTNAPLLQMPKLLYINIYEISWVTNFRNSILSDFLFLNFHENRLKDILSDLFDWIQQISKSIFLVKTRIRIFETISIFLLFFIS